MEKIYDPLYFQSSENIKIKEYFTKFKKLLNKSCVFDESKSKKPKNQSDDFTDALILMRKLSGENLTQRQEEVLLKSCNVNNLDNEDDPEQIDLKTVSGSKVICMFKPHKAKEDVKLQTIKCRKQKNINIPIKYNFDFDISPPCDASQKRDLKPGNDTVTYVTIFRPYKYTYADNLYKRNSLKFFSDMALLGSNTLADFRDKISCSADMAVCSEISENPDFNLVYPSGKEKYPSGFFFIDNVFYNDFRFMNSIDYSEVIRKWALDKKIGNFSTSEMSSTRIDSLTPRIGYPYVYQHKGCCEHIFIFSQIRLLNSSDSLTSNNYPYYSCIGRIKEKYCVVCGINVASWLICDSDRLPQSKAVMCTDCFKSYNYIEGVKIGNFKAYPYYTNASVI